MCLFYSQTLWFSRSEAISTPIPEPAHPRPLPTGLLAVLPREILPHLSVINPAEWQEAMWVEAPHREMPMIAPEMKNKVISRTSWFCSNRYRLFRSGPPKCPVRLKRCFKFACNDCNRSTGILGSETWR